LPASFGKRFHFDDFQHGVYTCDDTTREIAGPETRDEILTGDLAGYRIG
jgi:hypothetical protein